MSSNSWGAPTTWGGISPVGFSPVSSWGTIQTHPPLPKLSNTPSTIPLSFSSPAHTAIHVGSPWPGLRSTSSHSSAICPSPAGPASPTPNVLINPCLLLNSQNRLVVDFSIPPSEMPPHPSMGASAFSPSMTYARVIIKGPTTWFFELPHSPGPLTVASVLSQIYYFLQQVESPNDPLSSRMGSAMHMNVNPGMYRDQNFQRGGYGAGVKRIDLLGSRCCLNGFEPAGEQNTWILHFRSQ